jgi:hypothetical protein
MANENNAQMFSKLAAADLSDYQYHAVRISGNETINICNGSTQHPHGILWDKPDTAGQPAAICCFGETPAILGGTVTADMLLMADASGHLVERSGGWGAVARAMEGGSSGEIRKVFWFGVAFGNVTSP